MLRRMMRYASRGHCRSLRAFTEPGGRENSHDRKRRRCPDHPLERFRKEQISAAKEAKKKYDKETEKYCGVLEKHLSLSSKKKESHLQEADSQVDHVRQHFYEVSLEYVFKVQEVQERKMFEFVEPLLAFLQGLFTYYHHGYELAKDFNHFKTDLTISIQNLSANVGVYRPAVLTSTVLSFSPNPLPPHRRNRFESTRSEVECLMKKMKENPHEHKSVNPSTMEGYLFVQEKRSFVSSWVKYYCTYHREPKRVTMVLFDQKSGGKVGDEDSFTLKSCTRRKTDSIEKRFCFDVEAVDRAGVITMQALSEEDRRLWMEAMDGREPVYNSNRDSQSEGNSRFPHIFTSALAMFQWLRQLDEIFKIPRFFNVSFKKFIHAVETRGIDEQGLYRIVGVNSRVQKLLGLAMDPKTCADVELDGSEWEIKTITSALKYYLRMLPAPLMTYQFQRSFIKAAKLDNPEARITEVHNIVHRLPEKNRQMLDLLMKHLANVASHHQQNLMTVANLGVVFGPTLLRSQEETVAAIMDIKFQNIVIEILIENHERIFKDPPSNSQNHPLRRRSTETKPPPAARGPSPSSTRPRPPRKVRPHLAPRPHPLFVTAVLSQLQAASRKPFCQYLLTGSCGDSFAKRSSLALNSSVDSVLTHGSVNSNSTQGRAHQNSLTGSEPDLDGAPVGKQPRPNSLLSPKSRPSVPTSPASPSPTSPRSPSWPMFSAPSSPQPASSTSSDSSPLSPPFRKARALYACKAEHESELSFIAGTIFENGELRPIPAAAGLPARTVKLQPPSQLL
ncbi:hypothetical protein ANANG_G00149860 [Anguilla anguilla]|uniref:Rho GTPase-activating protein 26 n=1 Tax=Anguilla anguilla TaxID=7936 RepID=A0A9D3M6F7_ANGAN|nr:hypothetical protein ANANG_G00149860 [Anguilla anguilla]